MELAEDISLEGGLRDRAAIRDGSSSRRLRVAIVAPSLRYVGGQSVQADLLARNWEGDPDVQVNFVPVDPLFPIGLRWISGVRFLRTIVRTPFYLAGLWRGLRDADIAHIFSASYSSFVIAPLPAWLIATMLGKKTLIHYHSGEARNHLKKSRLARAVLNRAGRVVSPSGYLVDVFRDFELSAESVPNIIDFSQFTYRDRDPLRPHLVCTRGFHPYYSIDVVIKAFALVKKEYPDAQLDLVGGGTLETEMRRLVSDLKLPDVNFCGVASRSQIGRYYDGADVFINASRLDNMPVSILEAFASGTPVISTSPDGMRYLIEDGRTGLLSQVGDPTALAANVLRVLHDPALAHSLSTNARQELSQYYWGSVREQWLRVYRELLPQAASVVSETVPRI
jgi:glycosyltransferase involved in cell wall biosynthesis